MSATATILPASPTRNIRRTSLPNGLLVLTESIPHVRSVSMGVWIDSGSRDESLDLNGISHFVEHMVFKGTTSRSVRARTSSPAKPTPSAATLTLSLERSLSAFNIKVLDEHIAPAL